MTSHSAHAYALQGKSWPAGSVIVLQLGLGNAPQTLSDGNTSWDQAVLPVITAWNQQLGSIQFSAVINPTAASSGDHLNSVVFANSVFGQSFGGGTLAVTYYRTQGTAMIEADVLVNTAQTFDSYRGPLRFGSGGYATGDLRRVLLHELGHGIGLNHPDGAGQHIDAVMNSVISDRETLASDDIAGAQSIYGVAAPVPTPPPAPVPTPIPTPNGPTRLANISTRMKVGLGDDVLIGGFIVKGTQPKKMIIRASGPSLTAAGVPGAMRDPVLELHDGTGATIAQNDNWQTGGQSAEITATGLAPSQALESAVVATLQPGNYTAVVRGANNTQGIALVEGYELDTPTTRLVNLSTRGRIGLNDEVLIGGLIVQGSAPKKVIVRALGPSLAGFVNGALADPVLEMYNNSGTLIASNDNWSTSSQSAEIIATTVPPPNNLESAIVTTLPPGSYTAIVRGVNATSGVGLVEVYDLEP
ncbi:MAG: matrixin family metalloprotease [Chthoniobacterales bacterium]